MLSVTARLLFVLLIPLVATTNAASGSQPLVIAHRGASGYLPEHTLVSMALAHGLGADYIEQDVVLSSDGVAVVLHDVHLDNTTNVGQIFPDRARADGHYYAIDFTLAELKQLTVFERRSGNGKRVFKERFPSDRLALSIPTLAEAIVLIRGLNKSRARQVGFYIELKSPHFHQESGWDIAKVVLKVLDTHQLNTATAPVFLQCFDAATLRYLHDDLHTPLPLIQLIGDNSWGEGDGNDYDVMRSDAGLKAIAEYADGIGPWIPQLFDERYPNLGRRAHEHALLVHPYTLRVDQFKPFASFDDQQYKVFVDTQADGAFTDFPDLTRQFINAHFSKTSPVTEAGTH